MLVINLWGGPGAGKTTVAAELFVFLRKTTKANVELVGEFATDLCFEQAKANLKDQIYLLGNQFHRLWRLDKAGVDVAISDSPIGIGIPYMRKDKPRYYDEYIALVKALYDEYLTTNIMVERDIYAEGGFKGNKPCKNTGWLMDLDRQIRDVASPIYVVNFGNTAGTKVCGYIEPIVEAYMESKLDRDRGKHEQA